MKWIWPLILAGMTGCAHNEAVVRTTEPATASTVAVPVAPNPAPPAAHSEQVRTDCIDGRRLICGKVLKVFPDGLVIDSGYTDLLRPPLTQSWLIPGSVSASRDSAGIERKEPGSPGIGLVFLTDVPKRPKFPRPKEFDYVVIMGYPAGQFVYSPAPTIQKSIRTFSCGLDTAVRLRLQSEANSAGGPPHGPAQ
jgi:hypothetical protein